VDESLNWAAIKDNVLYVSNGHSTYAKSSYGQNAYLSAIDASSGRLLWRSAPLASNSSNFLMYKDAIITGYGFTAESHFLYVVNQKDGRIVQTIKLKKSPEYILKKGDSIFVRTYDTDYLFKAGNQGELRQRLPNQMNLPNQTNAPRKMNAPNQTNAPNQMERPRK
jgi:outer membrane protein assembly factor BamB